MLGLSAVSASPLGSNVATFDACSTLNVCVVVHVPALGWRENLPTSPPYVSPDKLQCQLDAQWPNKVGITDLT